MSRLPQRVRHTLRRLVSRAHPAPVFVLGNQKSGTTAIAALLGRAAGLPVTLDIFHRLPPSTLTSLLERRLPFADFVRRERTYFAPDIIKEPSLTFFYDELAAVFPRARHVFVLRDPRDNIRSILNRLDLPGDLPALDGHRLARLSRLPGWRLILDGRLYGTVGRTYIETLALRWSRAAEIYRAHAGAMALVRYEDFARDKKGAVDDLARRVGLDPRHDVSAEVDVQFQPRGDHRMTWPEFFGPENLACIERVCAEGMRALGYPAAAPPAATELKAGG